MMQRRKQKIYIKNLKNKQDFKNKQDYLLSQVLQDCVKRCKRVKKQERK